MTMATIIDTHNDTSPVIPVAKQIKGIVNPVALQTSVCPSWLL